ncbi:hypothetical protein Tco_1353196 [Tanacetum coccineum]
MKILNYKILPMSCMIVSWNLFPLPKSESLEGTVAREKVVPLLLQLPPSVNNFIRFPTNDDEDVDHNEGTSHASTSSLPR